MWKKECLLSKFPFKAQSSPMFMKEEYYLPQLLTTTKIFSTLIVMRDALITGFNSKSYFNTWVRVRSKERLGTNKRYIAKLLKIT